MEYVILSTDAVGFLLGIESFHFKYYKCNYKEKIE